MSSSSTSTTLPLVSLNHVSFLCKSVEESVKFYTDVLGFERIERPSSLKFKGAWLSKYGIGIHLLESDDVLVKKKDEINPKDNHISFQCSDMELIKEILKKKNIKYKEEKIEEKIKNETAVGEVVITVDQLFFHDPDGYMIEICNCENLTVKPPNANIVGNANNVSGVINALSNYATADFKPTLLSACNPKLANANESYTRSFYIWEAKLGVAMHAAA